MHIYSNFKELGLNLRNYESCIEQILGKYSYMQQLLIVCTGTYKILHNSKGEI